MLGQLDGVVADRPGPTGHQDAGAPEYLGIAAEAVGGCHRRYAQASTELEGCAVRQGNGPLGRQD